MTLYVSDLDGTLLNSKQELSITTVNIINDLIGNGLRFSIATARSFDSAGRIIEPLQLQLPIILHNGVFIFDPIEKVNILSNYLECEILSGVLKVFKEMEISPIIFTRNENQESKVYYKGIFNAGEEHYIKDRLAKKDKRFILTDDFSVCMSQDVITILAISKNETLEPAYEIIRNTFDLTCHYTVDIYSKANWLELTHKNANKRDSVRYLKKLLGFEKLVCFGDNLNDCSMFEIADEKYAVRNAHEILKNTATGIIGCNNEDGVAKFLKSVYKGISTAQ